MSKNSEYWGRRLQEITINRYDVTISETEKKLKRLYQSAMKKMQLETENTYIKLLETGKITRSELYQNSRFLELQDQFEIELAKLGTKEEKILSSLFAEEYETVFGMTREEMGEYKPQCIYNPLLANTIINQSWSGDNYSGRIWNNKNKLCTLLKDKTVDAILLGKSIDNVTKVVMDRFEAGYSDASRLVRSELMHTLNAAQQEVYKEAGYKELEILVYFDERTCDVCAKLDGTKLPIDSKDIPPIHARCRCTVIPVIEGVKGNTRLAEDSITGEKYKVPADMTYNEWWEKNVVAKYGQETVDAHMKMISNEYADRKQYEAYKKVLGKDVPKSFDKFQELKYTDSNSWGLFKDYAKSRSTNMISSFVSFDHYQQYNNLIEKQIVGLTTVDGVQITGQSKHFIERVFGTTNDPKVNRPRSGVEIDDIKYALLNGNIRKRTNDINSVKYITQKCIVSVNPNTGNLIQVNPQ